MRLIGALAIAICFFVGFGIAFGNVPRLRFGLGAQKKKADVTDRQLWLTQAQLELTPTQYRLGLCFCGAAVFALTTALTATPAVALAPAIAAMVLPHAFFSKRRKETLAQTAQAWPDAIRELVASIESNASLHGALVQLAKTGPEPLRPAFERFPLIASTVGTVPALESVRERLADPVSDRVIEVLILAHERGGGIVTDILRELATTTTEDLQLQEDIRSAQLEQKINGRVVFVIPWAVLIMLVMSDDNFRSFYRSAQGFMVVVGGAIASVGGMALLAFLSRERSEPRVFGGSSRYSGVAADHDGDDDDGNDGGSGGGGGGFDPDDGPSPIRGQVLRHHHTRYEHIDESQLIPVNAEHPTTSEMR